MSKNERIRGRHTPQSSRNASGPGTRLPGYSLLPALSLVAAAFTTVWWGFTGLASENFGSDCLFYFGESGPGAEHCFEVNDRAEAALPTLTVTAWIAAGAAAMAPRVFPRTRIAGAVVAVLATAAAIALGGHAMAVSRP